MKRCEKPDIPAEINGNLRLAIQHLTDVGDHRQQGTDSKFKTVFWMFGAIYGLLGIVITLLVTVALQI